MKIIPRFKVRGFILAAVFSAGLGFATSASARCANHTYLVDLNSQTVTDIGNFGGTGNDTNAYGINDVGQVAGRPDTAGDAIIHAFVTGPNGMGMRDLGTLYRSPPCGGSAESGRVMACGSGCRLDVRYKLLWDAQAYEGVGAPATDWR
jgi:probable HAF family extracellular repeat protein